MLSHILPPIQLDMFCDAAQIIDLAAKTGLPKDPDKYREAIDTCCNLLRGVMPLRTTTDLFHGKALLPLPALHAKRVPCRSRTQSRSSRSHLQESRGGFSLRRSGPHRWRMSTAPPPARPHQFPARTIFIYRLRAARCDCAGPTPSTESSSNRFEPLEVLLRRKAK